MRYLMAVLLLTSILVPVSAVSQTDAPRGSYPYSVFNTEPLEVRTPVWVNSGDTECAYNSTGYPSATDECMAEYKKAVIVEITHGGGPDGDRYSYRVNIVGRDNDGEWSRYRHTRRFGYLYELINLPNEYGKYSKYFLALNW